MDTGRRPFANGGIVIATLGPNIADHRFAILIGTPPKRARFVARIIRERRTADIPVLSRYFDALDTVG